MSPAHAPALFRRRPHHPRIERDVHALPAFVLIRRQLIRCARENRATRARKCGLHENVFSIRIRYEFRYCIDCAIGRQIDMQHDDWRRLLPKRRSPAHPQLISQSSAQRQIIGRVRECGAEQEKRVDREKCSYQSQLIPHRRQSVCDSYSCHLARVPAPILAPRRERLKGLS